MGLLDVTVIVLHGVHRTIYYEGHVFEIKDGQVIDHMANWMKLPNFNEKERIDKENRALAFDLCKEAYATGQFETVDNTNLRV